MSTHEEREILRQTVGHVVTALGEGWSVDADPQWEEYRGVYVDGPDGARLWLTLAWNNADRLEVQGLYPKPEEPHARGWSKRYDEERKDSITVRRDRDPAAIAREITRRLLPGYLEMLGEAVEANAKHDAAVRAGRDLRAAIADRLGKGARIVETRGEVSTPYHGSDSGKPSATFKAHDGGGVSEVEIRWLTDEQGLKLADFLTTL
ncbi:hypothetical protein ABRQ22_14850 [Cellulosimicrobium sp. ES-005]|uniref:DUF5655 domain-containing protein n=1 Tax=Cellulosimicrobium sp. ES-005 TaxID=3163031 RepID=A0AAU8FY98_9MICO